MRVVVVSPPAPIVTWEEADVHLGLGGDIGVRAYVESLIAAATEFLDGPEGQLGRAIGVQTLEARFALPHCATVRLPCPPIIDLVGVSWLDSDNVEQIGDLAEFEIFGADLAPYAAWPWSGGSRKREAGRVRYRAGYEIVPARFKVAILQMVGEMFEKREMSVSSLRGAAADLLETSQVFG